MHVYLDLPKGGLLQPDPSLPSMGGISCCDDQHTLRCRHGLGSGSLTGSRATEVNVVTLAPNLTEKRDRLRKAR